MTRATGGAIATDVQQEVTSLARVMKIVRRGDQVTARITDHDQDIEFPSEAVLASQVFELCITDVPGPGGTGGHGPAPAEGWLSATGVPLHNETVTIDARVYTFVTGAFTASGQIAIGTGGVPGAFHNLQQAIRAGTGAGVLYSTGTEVHATVVADVVDITLPDPLEATLLATGSISAYFSNFTTNSGSWHDGNQQMNNPNQAKTTDQTEGMWCGITLAAPTSIVYAKVYTVELWQTHVTSGGHEYDHACGWWFGPDGHIHHDIANVMMGTDGFTWSTGA